MTLSCSEILSIYYLTFVTIVSSFDYGQGDGSKDNVFEQNRNIQQNRPSNVGLDLMHNKDAADVASFKVSKANETESVEKLQCFFSQEPVKAEVMY